MWSLGHVCAPGEDDINCHCDWRVEIYKCQEETALYYIIIVNMIISALGFVLGKSLFLYLLKAFCGKCTQSVKTFLACVHKNLIHVHFYRHRNYILPGHHQRASIFRNQPRQRMFTSEAD